MHYTTSVELHQAEMATSGQPSAVRWTLCDFLTMRGSVCSRAIHRTS